MKPPKEIIRKITVNLPAALIDPLLLEYKVGPTEMIRELMLREKHRRACEKLRQMRGKVKFSLTYEQIKEDRE